ncbi:MAG TPA: hypothetical protein VHA30_02315 [Patescibacteria group bacterium]|nr:hypothetical protein [Patescibacteria group bacterium]
MKKTLFALSAAIFALTAGAPAMAAEFASPGTGGQVVIPQAETHKNLYAAGSNVTVNGSTAGDLTVAGGNISLNGPVSGGLLAGGGTVSSSAAVTGTARIAGGTVSVNAPIGGDLLAGGGDVLVSGSASIGGDLVAGGGTIRIDAPVAGSARVAGGTVYINSQISGRLDVMASESLAFGPQAVVNGDIYYRGAHPASVDPSAKIGAINFTQITRHYGKSAGGAFAVALIQFAALIAAGFLFIYLRRPFTAETLARVAGHPWSSLGWGALGLIAFPAAIVVLFVTVVGYYAALMLRFAFAVLLLAAGILGMLMLGHFALRLFNKTAAQFPPWQTVLLGAVLWQILAIIPFAGWIVLAIAFLIAFGAMLAVIAGSIRRQNQPAGMV